MTKILSAKELYKPEKEFRTDDWVAMHNYTKEAGVWRTRQGYIRIKDMDTHHLSATISFVERRDPNYRRSKVWRELVAEYHTRDIKLEPSTPEPELGKPKRKFRLPEE